MCVCVCVCVCELCVCIPKDFPLICSGGVGAGEGRGGEGRGGEERGGREGGREGREGEEGEGRYTAHTHTHTIPSIKGFARQYDLMSACIHLCISKRVFLRSKVLLSIPKQFSCTVCVYSACTYI